MVCLIFTAVPDVDECALGTDDCDGNATCTNLEGTFSCSCNDGFTDDSADGLNPGRSCTGNIFFFFTICRDWNRIVQLWINLEKIPLHNFLACQNTIRHYFIYLFIYLFKYFPGGPFIIHLGLPCGPRHKKHDAIIGKLTKVTVKKNFHWES